LFGEEEEPVIYVTAQPKPKENASVSQSPAKPKAAQNKEAVTPKTSYVEKKDPFAVGFTSLDGPAGYVRPETEKSNKLLERLENVTEEDIFTAGDRGRTEGELFSDSLSPANTRKISTTSSLFEASDDSPLPDRREGEVGDLFVPKAEEERKSLFTEAEPLSESLSSSALTLHEEIVDVKKMEAKKPVTVPVATKIARDHQVQEQRTPPKVDDDLFSLFGSATPGQDRGTVDATSISAYIAQNSGTQTKGLFD